MADEEIGARLKLKDRKQFSNDAERAARDVEDIGDKADKASRDMRTMGTSSGLLSKGLGGLKVAAVAGGVAIAAATGAVAAFGVQGYNSLKRIETIGAQTDAVLASTGGAANVTRMEIDNLAASLEFTTGVEAESITEGQNLLLTFTKIQNKVGEGNDIFDRATTSMVDMATALGTDSAGAALQLGKALNDPIKGVGALSRAGVSFTQEQKDQIKTMQESGDMLGAQKMILSELETQFGGSAEAFGKTTEGLTARTGHLFGTLQESIVSEFMPGVNGGIQKVHDMLLGLVRSSDEWIPRIGDTVRGAIDTLMNVGGTLVDAFQVGGIVGVAGELDKLIGTGDLLTSSVEALKSIFDSLGKIWEGLILPVLTDFNKQIPRGIRPLEIVATTLKWVADNGETLQPILAALLAGFIAFKVVGGILKGIAAAQALLNTVMAMNPIGLVIVALAALAAGLVYAWKNSETFRDIVKGALETVKNVVGGVKDAAMAVWNWINDNWPLLLAILTGPFGLAVLAVVENWDKIKAGATGVKDWIVQKFDEIVGFFTGLPARISEITGGMFDGIKEAFRSSINWIVDKWNGLEFSIPGVDTGIPGIGKIGGFTLGTPDIPRLHNGGTVTKGGAVNMLPGEEIVVLPPAASVVPMSDSVQNMAGVLGKEPVVVQVVLDRKVLAEAVYDHSGDVVARR